MFGALFDENGAELAKTIELPWRNNAPNISCIPPKEYVCTYNYSPAFKRNLYILLNVSGRSGIRIHPGSYAGAKDFGFRSDFLGCISFGSAISFDHVRQQHILTGTRVKIMQIERMLEYKDFILNITGEFAEII